MTILVFSVVAVYASSLPVIISSKGSIDYALTPGGIFEDGFESGDFGAWDSVWTTSGDVAEVSQTNPFEGNWHALFSKNIWSSGVEQAVCRLGVAPSRDEIFVSGYYCIVDGLPLDDDGDYLGLLALRGADTGWLIANVRIERVNGVDKFCLMITSGSRSWATTFTDVIHPYMNTWFSLELYLKVHQTAGEARIWINGIECLNAAGLNTASHGEVDEIRFGLISNYVQHPATIHVDMTTAGSRYIGPITLLEDGFESGGFDSWTSTYSTVGDWLQVDQTNPYDGFYSGRFRTHLTTSDVRYAYCGRTLSPALGEVYARGCFYIAQGLPLDNDGERFGLIGFEVGGLLTATLRVHRSGGVDRFNIVGIDGTKTVQGSTNSIYPSEGRWYYLEFYIRVDAEKGEYRAWINGVERITITGIDTTRYGIGVDGVRFGLTYTSGVQHAVDVYCDCAVISGAYVGTVRDAFAIVGSPEAIRPINNFIWLFGNQSIRYTVLQPSDVSDYADISNFDGLVVWTTDDQTYNAEAIRQFARTRPVISHVSDFCNTLFPSLSGSTEVVTTNTVTYVRDWGNFRTGDLVEMRNESSNRDKLTTVRASSLANFGNITQIARLDSSRVALFHMQGTTIESGFYVMDLHATTPETEWTGIWHIFPAIKTVVDFPTGSYARWMGDGQEWWTLEKVYDHIDTIAVQNNDIAEKWVIGKSVEGRDIPAIVIGEGARTMIIDGCIHGCEKTGTFVCLRIAELLVEYYRTNPFWQAKLSEYKVIIIPVLNPDGFARNTRNNANGKDLNRQFPPGGTTTEPEAWALRWLMGNYTPTVYINLHEGYSYYPLDLLYGNYETGSNREATLAAMGEASETFAELRHWGWFTEDGANVWIGEVRRIIKGGYNSMAIAYASSQHSASCMLMETFCWSQKQDARKCLWGVDCYTSVVISFLQNIER